MEIRTLKAFPALKRRIEDKYERLLRLKSDRERITTQPRMAPGREGIDRDKLFRQTATILELEEEIKSDVAALDSVHRDLETWLLSLEPQEERVMRARYQLGLPWDEVAERCGYGTSQPYKIQKRLIERGKLLG